jgi:cytochrome b6-f complex iron-sulfur subunit
MKRRSFLSFASLGAFAAALGTALAGILRLPNPAVLPGPVRHFKLGSPEEFAVGSETVFAEENFVLFHDREGFYAISATCTHLGCTVAQSKGGFACPCHGSRFDRNGKVIGGPAPRPLPWLEVSRAADGTLVVNADNEVPEGTRYHV